MLCIKFETANVIEKSTEDGKEVFKASLASEYSINAYMIEDKKRKNIKSEDREKRLCH